MIRTESFEYLGKHFFFVGKTHVKKSHAMSRHRQITYITMDLRGSEWDEFHKT